MIRPPTTIWPGDSCRLARSRTGIAPWATWWWGAFLLLMLVACTALPAAPRRVILVADGQQRTVETTAASVQALLAETGVTLGALDRVMPPETAGIQAGMTITVTRVTQRTETVTATVAFGRQLVRDATLPEGETRLLQAGAAGVQEWVYQITTEDGVQTGRVLVREGLAQPPRDEVLLVGTRPRVDTLPISGTLAYLGRQDAWLLRESNRNPRRLTTFGDLDGRVFALAPDGTRLLFTRVVSGSDHINDLWLVNTVQAGAVPVPVGINDLLWADWSPDGTTIAWTTAEPADRAPGWRGTNDLWVATLNTKGVLSARRKVLEAEAGGGYGWWGTRYVWDPSGQRLAYSRPDEVGVVALDKKQRSAWLRFPAYRTYSSWAWNPGVTWSPDGSLLATVRHSPAAVGGDPEESPVFDLWGMVETAAASGVYSGLLVSETGMWAAPRFSPDGNTLLFGRARVPYQSQLSGYTLCTVDRDGSNRTCLYPPEGEPGLEIPAWVWSPAGESLAFIYQNDLYWLPRANPVAIPVTDAANVTALDWR